MIYCRNQVSACRPQLTLSLKPPRTWGGAREGAGRPRTRKGVAHETRHELSKHHPVHVTLRVRSDISSLRSRSRYFVVRDALRAGRERDGFRLVHFSVQSNHLHLITEADDRGALARGIQALKIRIARALNACARRKGAVFSDRCHAHALKTPRETRNAIAGIGVGDSFSRGSLIDQPSELCGW